MPPECTTAAECTATHPASQCGTWDCPAGTCVLVAQDCFDVDGDDFWVGDNCKCDFRDCDDTNESVTSFQAKACFTGPMETGTCSAGTTTCISGAWSACVGEVAAAPAEACNGADDDCDGAIDDNLPHFTCGLGVCAQSLTSCVAGQLAVCAIGAVLGTPDTVCDGIDSDCDGAPDDDCLTSCVYVSPTGLDGTANGSLALPFGSVQAAINFAAANGKTQVCVGAGLTCNNTFTYASANATTITMANGVNVYGGYELTTGLRCPGNLLNVALAPKLLSGVIFPSTVATPTVLDGFKIDRPDGGGGDTTGITVDGAAGAVIAHVDITDPVTGFSTAGVRLMNGAKATIARSTIDGGQGTTEATGVLAVGSEVHLKENCATWDNLGRCTSFCGGNPSIRGRMSGTGTTASYAIRLQDAPGSTIESSAICGNVANKGSAIRIKGSADGVMIRANGIHAFGGITASHGIWLEDCGGAAPWIVSNYAITAGAGDNNAESAGIHSVGACHPVIEKNGDASKNTSINSGDEASVDHPRGVSCASNGVEGSRCFVIGNVIRGSSSGDPVTSVGVICEDRSCVRVAQNNITGRGGQETIGVELHHTGPFVDNNFIRGGCGDAPYGVWADDAISRVQNNRIFALFPSECADDSFESGAALLVLADLDAIPMREIDVHSNTIDSSQEGAFPGCNQDVAIALGAFSSSSVGAGGRGMFRNNILRAGACASSAHIFESSGEADPRLLLNNVFDPYTTLSALYNDADTALLSGATMINALGDITVQSTLELSCGFVMPQGNMHLVAGSPCDDQGTPEGAPLVDMDGQARNLATPTIGADELP